ncbi:MAG: flagellar assembly protein FliH [Gammaproteobacteria bacterium]
MSKVICGNQVDAVQPWRAPEVGQGESSQGLLTAGQMEALQDQARQEGFDQGLQEGRAAGAQLIKDQVTQLASLFQALQAPFAELDETVEEQLVQLSLIVARQLVRRELKTDPEQVIAVVREAMAALPVTSRELRLILHPDDIEMVRDALSMHEEAQNINIVSDPVQTRGGCRILTESSQIDATVESRINAIIANVLGGERRADGN